MRHEALLFIFMMSESINEYAVVNIIVQFYHLHYLESFLIQDHCVILNPASPTISVYYITHVFYFKAFL